MYASSLPVKISESYLYGLQVSNTPDSHVTRDYREGRGKLGDLWFKAIDTSGESSKDTEQLPDKFLA